MHEQVASLFLRIGHLEAHAVGGHRPGVADLAAGFAVERRLVDDHRASFAGLEFGHSLAVADQRSDHAFGGLGLVAQEFSGAHLFAEREPHRIRRGLAGAGPRGARLGLLLLHRGVEGV